jgi:hypothetical protein
VVFNVQFRGLGGVVSRVRVVTTRRVGVMGCFLVVAGFVVPGGLAVMVGCVFMVLGGFPMVLSGLF